MELWKKKFKCIEPEKAQIWGDFDSSIGGNLFITFDMCDGHDYCESKEDILDWLRGKYIVLLYNRRRFDQQSYFDKSVTENSKLQYVRVNTQMRQQTVMQVQ